MSGQDDYNAQLERNNLDAAIQAAQNLYVIAMKKLAPRQGVTANDGGAGAAAAAKLSEEKIITVVAAGVGPIIRDLRQEVAALKRVREGRHCGKYQGEWSAQKLYQPGDHVNVYGSMWRCTNGNMGMAPGISPAWKLTGPGVRS